MKRFLEGRSNQAGEPAFDEYIHTVAELNDDDKDEVIDMLISHLGLVLYRTNRTKHGNTELQLRQGD